MTVDEFKATLLGDPAQGLIELYVARKYFAQLLGGLGYQRGAEVGIWAGGYSSQLWEGCPGLFLYGVDPWLSYTAYDDPKNNQAKLHEARERARAIYQRRGEILEMTSQAAAPRIPDGSLDFVYIDGNHGQDYVTADLELWVPKVRSGGIVSGHDYMAPHHGYEVKPAVDAFVAKHGIGPVAILAKGKHPSFCWMKR